MANSHRSNWKASHDDTRWTFVVEGVPLIDADPVERIELVRRGFPAAVLKQLADGLDWSKRHVIDTLALRVRIRSRLTTGESERVLCIADAIKDVQTMVDRSGDADGFDAARWLGRWLDAPNRALGGHPPASYLDTIEGGRLIRQLLAQLETGAYA